MQTVDEYKSYAKLFRDLAEDAAEPDKSDYLKLAEEWEILAQERREIAQMRPRKTLHLKAG